MASIAYQLMQEFGKNEREASTQGDYDSSFAWNSCESTVNNLHHGLYPRDWLPRVVNAVKSLQANAETDAERAVYAEALELLEVAVLETAG